MAEVIGMGNNRWRNRDWRRVLRWSRHRITGRSLQAAGQKFYQLALGTNTYLLIRYMSSKLQTNGKKTSPVITLQMLGFFRIY